MHSICYISLAQHQLAGNVAAYIRQHCCTGKEQLLLKNLCRHFGVCETSLKQVFKQRYGTAIHAYIIRERMKAACNLLQAKRAVKEVAWATGYEELSNFSRDFKNHMGLSPSQYQEQWRQQLQGQPLSICYG
ncbi:MAG: AraC family transcriptional regulator [Sphingobacteriia bacterium]|nr:AraC family transcriptional regulator [Sphingobacteriia bacterium]